MAKTRILIFTVIKWCQTWAIYMIWILHIFIQRQIKSVDVNWICRGFNTKDEDEINGLEIPPNMVMKDSLSK